MQNEQWAHTKEMGQSIGVVQVCCSKVAQVEMQAVRITGQCEANKLQPVKMKQVVSKLSESESDMYLLVGYFRLFCFLFLRLLRPRLRILLLVLPKVPSVKIDLKEN